MAGTLEGRVAIVTGSTRGIGKAVAVAMARNGARVVVCGRSSGPDTGEGVGSIEATIAEIESDGGEAIGIRCDISREEDATGIVAGALERWGRVDVLVNNAASLWRQGLLNTTPAKWRELLHTNLDGVYYCTHAVLPSMMQQGGGSIISLTSGRSNAIDGKTTAYTIAKTGVEKLTANLAEEVREHGIAVNAVDPGPVLTKGVMDNIEEERYAQFYAIDDEHVKIVPACMYLAAMSADPARFITGQVLKASEYPAWVPIDTA